MNLLHFFATVLLSALLTLSGSAQATQAAPADPTADGWHSLADIPNGRIGYVTGTVFDAYLHQHYAQARIVGYNNSTDLIQALKTGKLDAALVARISAQAMVQQTPELAILGKAVMNFPLGVGFAKSRSDLRERFNAWLARARTDGRYQTIHARWFVGDPEQAVMPVQQAANPRERYVLAVSVADMPYVAYKDGRHVGFDIEILQTWAADENIQLDIHTLDFGALLPAIVSGKADLISDGIAITDERRKAVDFSAPYAEEQGAAIALRSRVAAAPTTAATATVNQLPATSTVSDAASSATSPGWVDSLTASLTSTFITEQRWRLVLDGLWITLTVSLLATVFGTVLGAGICALRMAAQPLLQHIGRLYIGVMRGLPVLLLLMLTYYVAFARIDIHPVAVAVLAFGMNFAAYVAEIFRSGVRSIDRGQTEAGIAMGFSRVATFSHFILPQAVQRVLPVYRGEFISLIKMTSIVGYIGVMDLTKASDIIRSRTFEAFFPLVMVSLAYFLVIWLLGLLLDQLEKRSDPAWRRAQRQG